MTNLQRWLFYIGLFTVPYIAIMTGALQTPLLSRWKFEIQMLPLGIVAIFGLCSAIVVLYRTFNLNDCPEAAKELQKQIDEARRDLIAKSFKFRD